MFCRVYRLNSDTVRIVGYRVSHEKKRFSDSSNIIPLSSRIECNLSRARSTIRELGLCNPWEYFVTITLDSRNQPRDDLQLFKRRLNQCVKDFNRKYSCSLKYLLIPELHSDMQNWHCHGLVFGLPSSSLVLNKNGYYTIPYFENRFGFLSLSPIKDLTRVSSYITKYVSKSISLERIDSFQRGEHMFLCSVGLKRKELIGEIVSNDAEIPFQFTNDYVSILEINLADISVFLKRKGLHIS